MLHACYVTRIAYPQSSFLAVFVDTKTPSLTVSDSFADD